MRQETSSVEEYELEDIVPDGLVSFILGCDDRKDDLFEKSSKNVKLIVAFE